MKVYNFYAVDFSSYKGIDIKPSANLEHCTVFPLDCDTSGEAISMLKEGQMLLRPIGVLKDGDMIYV